MCKMYYWLPLSHFTRHRLCSSETLWHQQHCCDCDGNCAWLQLAVFLSVKLSADVSANSFWICRCLLEAHLHKKGCHFGRNDSFQYNKMSVAQSCRDFFLKIASSRWEGNIGFATVYREYQVQNLGLVDLALCLLLTCLASLKVWHFLFFKCFK